MPWNRFILTLVLITAASVSAALVQGRLRHRWGPSESVREAAARLQEFPRDFGQWHMTSARELDDESRRQLACVGEMVRVYTNPKTGDCVSLLLVLGPTGPIAVHTPQVCLGQRDFTPLDDRNEAAVGNGNDRFWNQRFKSRNIHGETLSFYWAWSTGGSWMAPQDARFAFAGSPFLYKIQVACAVHGAAGDANDSGREFLAAVVGAAEKYTVADIQY